MSRPLISIIVPCYNQGRFLAEAINSVLRQSYCNSQIVVVNDGSLDDTERVASEFDGKITYVKKQNAGRSAARNTGILAAEGTYVIFLDADDLLEEGTLEHMVAAAAANPNADVFVGGWRNLVNDKLDDVVSHIPIPEDLFHGIMARNIGLIHCFMVRRSALANSGLFDVNLSAAEDWDLWIRLGAAGCRFAPVLGSVAIYRRYPESSTSDYEHVMQGTRAVLDKNALAHGNCPMCRQATKAGWKSHFNSFVVPGAIRDLKKLVGQKRIVSAVCSALVLITRYPPLLPILMRAAVRQLIWGRQGASTP
jgi:glycosyltransferase involved in cell wall biosynthesis